MPSAKDCSESALWPLPGSKEADGVAEAEECVSTSNPSSSTLLKMHILHIVRVLDATKLQKKGSHNGKCYVYFTTI